MTTCLKVTILSEVTNSLKVKSLLEVIVSLAKVAYSVGITFIKIVGTKGASTEGASIRATFTKSACIRNTSTCAGSAYIGAWGADIGDEFIRDICIRYTDIIGTVKRLGLHWRLSQILELRQYSLILKIGIRVG